MCLSLLLPLLLIVATLGGTVESFKTHQRNSCFLNNKDEFTCIGQNGYGQLGQPERDMEYAGNLGDKDDETGDNLPVIDLGNDLTVVDFDVGSFFACAIRSDNKVVCWGYLYTGQNGMTKSTEIQQDDPSSATLSDTGSVVPTEIHLGEESVYILDAEGNVYGWGENGAGELGYGSYIDRVGDNYMGDNLVKIDLGVDRTVTKFETGYAFACALLDDSTVKCFGQNSHLGILGQNDTMNRGSEPYTMGDNLTSIDFGDGFIPKDIGAHDYGGCAVSTLGEVKCWGWSPKGQLGLEGEYKLLLAPGPVTDIGTDRTAVKIAVGQTHVCVLRDDGSVVCWGENGDYNLGTGTNVDVGNNAGDMGDNLVPIDFGDTDVVADVICGLLTTCLMFEDKRAKCYGRTYVGTLGYGDIDQSGKGENVSNVDYMMFRASAPVEATECSVVITTEGDSSLTWDLTDSEGDEEIASGEFGGDSVTITASTSEGYLLFLSSSTVPSGSITVTIDGDATTYELDSNTPTESEIADLTCEGITAATTDGSIQASLSLVVLMLSILLLN